MSEKQILSIDELDKANGGDPRYAIAKYYTFCTRDQGGFALIGPIDTKQDAENAGKNWCQAAHDKGYTGTKYRVSYNTDSGWINYDLISYPA